MFQYLKIKQNKNKSTINGTSSINTIILINFFYKKNKSQIEIVNVNFEI